MTNITFSIDDEIHKQMREHPEIKWTEILRQSIVNYLEKVEEIDTISIDEFRKRLDPEILEKVENLDLKEQIEYTEEIKVSEKKRLAQLNKLEQGEE